MKLWTSLLYLVVWGDEDLKDLDSEFSVTEGNHVILGIPENDEYVFLECTSQTAHSDFLQVLQMIEMCCW
ncbi:hypothetical protein Q2T40_05645 [Winogradskyella maritima]|nr:hypothetical protein [Winogradskyella maritima]